MKSPAPGSRTFERTFRTRLSRAAAPLNAGAVASVLTALAAWWVLQMPFVAQPAVPIELPETAVAEPVRYDAIIVAVTADGQVFAGDQPVTIEELDRRFESAVRQRPDISVLIEADRRVSHEVLVRIYEAAARHRIQRIALAARISARGAPNAPP